MDPVTIETASGRLAGTREGGIARFMGIPFAAPPVGPLRWCMAEPVKPWAGVRDATRAGAKSPQAPNPVERMLGGAFGAQDEDCLYLNVWSPGVRGKLPVMVWLHGGGFAFGAGSQSIYDGTALARRGVVVVSINYRLGAFGFLNLRDATDGRIEAGGSEGLSDQVRALQWVQDNIAAFGGDTDNITLFGESAGGMSVAALMASPSARGLFHKAIAQSGAGHIGHGRERSARAAHTLLKKLEIGSHDVEALRAIPADRIVRAQIGLSAEARVAGDPNRLGLLAFQPTIDEVLLPERPIDAIRMGSARSISLLTGTTREEWKLYSAFNPAARMTSAKKFAARLDRLGGTDYAHVFHTAYGEGSTFDRLNALMTDKVFAVPAARLLDAQAEYAPAYGYRFDWRSRLLGGMMGSCHALELGFVFGTYGQRIASSFFGKGPEADALSEAMQQSWVAFAKTGDPATNLTGEWPRHDSRRPTMIFGNGPPVMTHAPTAERLAAWRCIAESRLGL